MYIGCPLPSTPQVRYHDVSGQRAALRTESVADPRAHAGKARDGPAGKQFVLSCRVDDHVSAARADDGQVIDAPRQMGEQVGHLDAARHISGTSRRVPSNLAFLDRN